MGRASLKSLRTLISSILAISFLSTITALPQTSVSRRQSGLTAENSVPVGKLIDISQSNDQRIPEIDNVADVVRASKLLASDGGNEDNFGQAVAMSGSTVVVGSPSDTVGSNYSQGSAYVFIRIGASWVPQGQLIAPDGAAYDAFGASVAVNGDRIVVGAPQADVAGKADQGSAYVFSRIGTVWNLETKLTAGDGLTNDNYGYKVAVDGDTVAVAAPNDDVNILDNQGSVYVYTKVLASWSQQVYLTASDGDEHDNFGMAIGLNGNTMVVGAPNDDLAMWHQGTIYVFTRAGTVWSQQAQLMAVDAAAYDNFGWSVAISGDTVVAGAPGDDVGYNTDQGSAYVFVRSGGMFTQQAKITAYDGGADDQFGSSVAIDGDTLVVGSPDDANGTNYDQGSAYICVRSGNMWVAQLKLLVSDGATGDKFGYSVGASGFSVTVGAPWDSIGTNYYQGSAYIVEFIPSASADFDGDGLSDISVFRPNGASGQAEWWYMSSATPGTYGALGFGSDTDIPVPADYTGDGKTDVAFFRPSNGYWYIVRSEDYSFYAFPFGSAGDSPAPADYDGDGKADAAVFRGSSGMWYGLRSSDNRVVYASFGQSGDKPVVADYDGDGRADIALFRKYGASGAEWWINRSTLGVIGFAFGEATDVPVPGDYTGDGKADVAFFRASNSNWYVLRSNDFSFYAFPFGISTDIPAQGDYDGDGKTDPAVFRQGQWYIFNSSTGSSSAAPFGNTDDVPVPGILH